MNLIRVILADDHEIVRNGIKLLLERQGNIQVIAEVSDGKQALEKVAALQPDILIVDIRMPVLNGIETTRQLAQANTNTKALVLSMHDDEEYILQSIDCGAYGYLLKDTNQLEFIKAIETVAKGEKYFSGDISKVLVNRYLSVKTAPVTSPPPSENPSTPVTTYDLTKREKQIYKMLYQGVNNKEIADQLKKSIRTIETHRFNIMKKVGVSNVVDLLRKVEAEPALKKLLLDG
ncbi:MAG TPA: DNA-binding response regulator [Microscillaceae bacterium]|nr:DNA-binding response regulator [Microscillaceae bacterium]